MSAGGYHMYAQQYPFQWHHHPTGVDYWSSAALAGPPPMAYGDPLVVGPNMVAIPPYSSAAAEARPNVPKFISPIDGNSSKTRKPRATQACEQCRTRKQRCDEGEPCTFCRSNDLNCSYRQLMPTKSDKVVEYLLSWVATHADGLRGLTEKIESLEECIRSRGLDIKDTATAPMRTSSALKGEHDTHRSTLFWPEVRKLFAASGLQCDESYIARAEETHTLLQTNTGLGRPGIMSISICTINRLHDAFLAGIWPLQPFLDRDRLSSIMEAFSRVYASNSLVPDHSRPADNNTEPPAKRRRVDSPAVPNSVTRYLEQSPDNAIALLVLSLGETVAGDSAVPMEADAVPGWTYYAAANRCMSSHIDGSSLAHAHIFLLAGIYKARLGRLAESASWYSMAGRVLLHLVRRHDLCKQQFSKASFDLRTREGRIVMTAWCSLRLEKGVLQELQSPQSGLEDLQHLLPLPPTAPDGDTSTSSMDPIQTSRALCELHNIRRHVDGYLHQAAGPDGSVTMIEKTMKQYASTLQSWRANIFSACWDDSHELPSSQEHACLRYEYWKTKLAILSPFLDYVLHILPGVRLGMDLQSCSLDANGHLRSVSVRNIIAAINLMAVDAGEDEVLRLAELAIDALTHKLSAFQGIYASTYSGMASTAHEQFQDLLVLHSAHRSGCLHTFVPMASMRLAYGYTADLLDAMAGVSPTCREDCNILKRIRCALIDPPLHSLAG